MESAALHILPIVFLATLIRSAFGFGEALIAVPLLALFLPLQVAAPLAVLLSITIAGVVVVQDWREIHFRSAGWLLLATLPGLPCGLLLLTGHHQSIVKAALGVILLAFAAFSLFGRTSIQLDRDRPAWLAACGFSAGVLGGAYGMNGPPLVIYGTLRRWSARHFRATLQAYFLPASLLAMTGYWLAGLWVPAVTRDYLLSLPVMVPALFLGRAINRRLHGNLFLRVIYAGLACIGVLLIVESARTGMTR
ncbi:MAG: sulfite exporter TauE/SafE family protein [Acidobacteriota bacterium]